MRLLKRIKKRIEWEYHKHQLKKKPKIFCLGKNKTGSTSFKEAFKQLGYSVGDQHKAEYLLPEYKSGNFQKIIEYCKTAQVFQDFPFSKWETFKHLDNAFPDAKFVLTVRDSPEQWYDSCIRFYSKIFGNGEIPTKEDLQNSNYRWKGRPWEVKKISVRRLNLSEDDLYNKEKLIKDYCEYNKAIIDYFRDRPDKLIVINVAKPSSYEELMDFLGIDSPYKKFPWKNKTSQLTRKYSKTD